MSAPSYGARWPVYARAWDAMTIPPARAREVRATAVRLAAAKAQYQTVEKLTGVPWFMIAVIHEREASQNWNTQLAEGDPLRRVSTHVPRGMGPFATWEAGAVAALEHEGFEHVIDWRLEKILFYLEAYNGWGYWAHGVPSPYLWGATGIQRPGKYVADGVWSSRALDQQLGCAALIKATSELDKTIQIVREDDRSTPMAAQASVPAQAGTQGPEPVAPGSRLAAARRPGHEAATAPPQPRSRDWLQALRDWFSSLRNLVRKA